MGTVKVVYQSIIPQFPHCDSRVLHKPGECEFCDQHEEWQALREAWGIAFTGHSGEVVENEYGNKMLPCPAEFNRGMESINGWHGNVPENAENKAIREKFFQSMIDFVQSKSKK